MLMLCASECSQSLGWPCVLYASQQPLHLLSSPNLTSGGGGACSGSALCPPRAAPPLTPVHAGPEACKGVGHRHAQARMQHRA